MIDFAGEIYARQEGQSILLGTYEQDNRPWSPNETPWDFVFQLLPHDLDRIAPELERGVRPLPRRRPGRHQEVRQRSVHVQPRRQPAGRPDQGHARHVGGVRGDGRPVAGRRRRPVAGQLDGERRPAATTSGGWTSPATATTRRSRTPTPRCARTTRAASGSRSPTRSSPPAGRCTPRRSTTGSPSTTRCGAPASASSTRCGSRSRASDPMEDVTFHRSNAFPLVAEESRAVRERVGLSRGVELRQVQGQWRRLRGRGCRDCSPTPCRRSAART